MASVTFISGSMFGGKSKVLMDCIESSHKDNMTKYLVFKPTMDIRDGLFIKSRAYNDRIISAFAWNQNDTEMTSIFNYMVAGFALTNPDDSKNIFFDEVHFLPQQDVESIVEVCKKYDVNVYFSGLETDFRLDTFDVAKWLKNNCDSYVFFHGSCAHCREDKAVYNIILNSDGKPIYTGDQLQPQARFHVFCKSCYGKLT